MPITGQQSGLLQSEVDYVERRVTEFFDNLQKEGITPACISHANFWISMRFSLEKLDENSFEFYLEQVENMLGAIKYGSGIKIPKDQCH